jgi:hypothetical protein
MSIIQIGSKLYGPDHLKTDHLLVTGRFSNGTQQGRLLAKKNINFFV